MSDKENIPQFPPWLAEIMTPSQAWDYVCRQGFEQYADDICSMVVPRMENARERHKEIRIGYIKVALKRLGIDFWRKDKSEKRKQERKAAKLEKEKLKEEKLSLPERLVRNGREDLLDKIINKIGGLNLRDRVIVKLKCHREHKFTYKEIANVTNFSASTVRVEFGRICTHIESKLNSMDIPIEEYL